MLDPVLLRIAKSSILGYFEGISKIDKADLINRYPFLAQDGAAFVTLNSNNNLRGCIGSIIAHRSLLEDIIHNAYSSAFKDSRFSPLNSNEFDDLTLEVSVLTKPQVLEYEDFEDLAEKIRPNVDGLILKHGVYQGTFLPQVWEQLPDAKIFLQHLSMKAGSHPGIYDRHPEIYIYQVEAIEKKFNEIEPL